MLLSKNACYSAKSMLLSQKQRRYTYDSIVYAPTLTLLTILFILQVLIKAHLSFEHLIFNGFNNSRWNIHLIWIYHSASLTSCKNIKFTMVHPSFSKKWQKIAKKSKPNLQSALGIHDFFAFFCISQISQKKNQITL